MRSKAGWIQEGCRRVLRIAADRWVNPQDWTFKASFVDGDLNFVLVASMRQGDKKLETRVVFPSKQVNDDAERLTMEHKVSQACAEMERRQQSWPDD